MKKSLLPELLPAVIACFFGLLTFLCFWLILFYQQYWKFGIPGILCAFATAFFVFATVQEAGRDD